MGDMSKSEKCVATELCLCLLLYHPGQAGVGRGMASGSVSRQVLQNEDRGLRSHGIQRD